MAVGREFSPGIGVTGKRNRLWRGCGSANGSRSEGLPTGEQLVPWLPGASVGMRLPVLFAAAISSSLGIGDRQGASAAPYPVEEQRGLTERPTKIPRGVGKKIPSSIPMFIRLVTPSADPTW